LGKRGRLRLVVLLAVVAILLASIAGHRWLRKDPPFGPEAIAPNAVVELVDNANLSKMLKSYGASDEIALQANPGDQLVIGKVSWRPPPKPLKDGWFAIVLIDKDSGLKPPVMNATGPHPEKIRIGSDRALNTVAERYSWLKGAGDTRAPNGSFVGSSEAVLVYEDEAPIIFVALFPSAGSPDDRASARASPAVYARAPVTLSELMVALVYIGADRQVYWAERLYG